MFQGNKSLLIAIPAFNESESLGSVISAVRSEIPGATIAVINDCSTDSTSSVARLAQADVVLDLPVNLGVGGAMRTAFHYAKIHDFDFFVQIDGDGQHLPSEALKVIALLDSVDVGIGARFAGVGSYEVRGPRKWAMSFLAWTLSRICGTTLTDTTSGLRGANKSAISLFATHYPAEYLGDTVESLVIAKRNGLSIGQVGVAMAERTGGTPSQSPVKASLYLIRAMMAVIFGLIRRPAGGSN